MCYCCCSRACVPAIILLHSLRYLSSPGTAYITGREAARARNIPAENHPVRNIAHQSGYNHRNDATVTVHQSQPHFCKYIFCTFAFTQHGAIWGPLPYNLWLWVITIYVHLTLKVQEYGILVHNLNSGGYYKEYCNSVSNMTMQLSEKATEHHPRGLYPRNFPLKAFPKSPK